MDAITVQPDVLNYILNTLGDLKRDLIFVREKLEAAPAYGSDAWWEWSINQSLEDIKEGKYKTFKEPKALQKYLDSLK